MIALEEHFFSTYASNDANYGRSFNGYPAYVNDGLRSLQDPKMRLQCMAAGNIAKQILSHTPVKGLGSSELCRSSNNELCDAFLANRSRFVGFALLPMAEPEAAAAELERCVKKLGFVGALLGCHLDGTFYDGIKFRPVFNKAVELDVPLYIHHCPPSDAMAMFYHGNYSARVASDLSTFSWGWHEQWRAPDPALRFAPV
ncbi:MAG: hypothetical protein MMC33_002786 [Icmadophila ericetorum]|nr:hypothetical protein [Icmadophila ericetorum]